MDRPRVLRRPLVRATALAAALSLLVPTAACQGDGPVAREARASEPASDLSPERLQAAVDAAHAAFADRQGGKNADYIPYLAKVPSGLFGVVIATADGEVYTAGDVDYAFSIQSVSKPFTAALVMQQSGAEALHEKIGVEPTGLPFNSVTAVELLPARSVNPLVNAGAMAAVSMLDADGPEERWRLIQEGFARFAGEPLELNEEVCASEMATNAHNQGIAQLLASYDRLYCDPVEACTVYTRQCSLGVTAKQLALMGATLANRGVNPRTGERCLDEEHVPKLLAVMMMAGFYDEAGLWAWHTGLPAKTGVGGGVVAIVPGRMAIVGFAPPLDEAGNSWRGSRAVAHVVRELDLNLFAGGR